MKSSVKTSTEYYHVNKLSIILTVDILVPHFVGELIRFQNETSALKITRIVSDFEKSHGLMVELRRIIDCEYA